MATVRSSELLAKLELEDLDLILRERRLRWFAHVHVEHSSGAVRTACDIQINGRLGAVGRPKLTWKKLMEKDCNEWIGSSRQLTVKNRKEHMEIRCEICYACS